MDTLLGLAGAEQARLIRSKQVSPVELMDAVLQLVHALNPVLHAFCELNEEEAKRSAVLAEQQVMREEELGPLHGVPLSVKDLILTKGIRTAFGSRAYEQYVPSVDDVCVDRMKRAGAIVIGKTNVSEFGYRGVSGRFGVLKNPWDMDVVPGSSSGGSAVAVATGMGALTLGSDGGGSIRIPASLNGLYGLKPSMGRVPLYPGSRDPSMPGSSSWESLECIGPLSRTVEDAALIMSVIAGPHPMDRHSLPGLPDYMAAIRNVDLRGLRVAWSEDLGYAAVEPEIRQAVRLAANAFEQMGCIVEQGHPDLYDPSDVFLGLIARDSDLAGLRKLAEQYGEDMNPFLRQFISRTWRDEDLTEAAMSRQQFNIAFRTFMLRYDLLLIPTLGVPPFPAALNAPTVIDGREVSESHWSTFNCWFNMTGQPAATVPIGWTSDGLPVGLQIVGGHLQDEIVLRASAALEQALPWRQKLDSLVERWTNPKNRFSADVMKGSETLI
ncbi:glutamyl-tRNA amidotransferase [Paenibacillus agaridevorans]|uniref:Glutamyl-tRNA amidotransferase n=1 Tax=Paenibacillus agaridevorans TaxID=171404 RepID=A0A2R5F215_9BACL|nr:amidase family protein [Paenibacillus agaridevorans]GBG09794.1 glutamyl-tRNA amidotransferase [Paenibacillus agaridevorans]